MSLEERRVLHHFGNLFEAEVVARLSRVTVLAQAGDARFLCHLRNTGRLYDVIYEGARIIVMPKPSKRTHAVVIGSPVNSKAALLDTYYQARCFEEAVRRGLIGWLDGFTIAKRDTTLRGVRIDYKIRRGREQCYLELKSAVYLDASDNYAMYPDAPSTRGRRHIEVLTKIAKRNRSIITFITAHPLAVGFKPCNEGDPEIQGLLRRAVEEGVEVYAVKMFIDENMDVVLESDNIPVKL